MVAENEDRDSVARSRLALAEELRDLVEPVGLGELLADAVHDPAIQLVVFLIAAELVHGRTRWRLGRRTVRGALVRSRHLVAQTTEQFLKKSYLREIESQ
jgi:hypothetical protein